MRYQGKSARSLSDLQVIELRDLTEEQRAVLKVAGRERVLNRLIDLIGRGAVSVSQVQDHYAVLMSEVGDA